MVDNLASRTGAGKRDAESLIREAAADRKRYKAELDTLVGTLSNSSAFSSASHHPPLLREAARLIATVAHLMSPVNVTDPQWIFSRLIGVRRLISWFDHHSNAAHGQSLRSALHEIESAANAGSAVFSAAFRKAAAHVREERVTEGQPVDRFSLMDDTRLNKYVMMCLEWQQSCSNVRHKLYALADDLRWVDSLYRQGGDAMAKPVLASVGGDTPPKRGRGGQAAGIDDDPYAPYMPPHWFGRHTTVKVDLLRSARRDNRLASRQVGKARFHYSVPDAHRLWPEDVPASCVEQARKPGSERENA